MAVGTIEVTPERPALWERPVLAISSLTWEKILYTAMFVVAIISRFWDLGARAMSHDESLHTTYSWYLYAGRGFQASPLMHGPSLFEFTALSYWLFGDSDYTARIVPAVLGVILAIGIPLLLRRWLGWVGSLFTAFFLLISPAVLFHSRYIRHDVPIITLGAILFVAVLFYHQRQHSRYLYWAAAATSLMFTTMETSFIYIAIFGSFLILRFLPDFFRLKWEKSNYRTFFYASLGLMVLLGIAMVVLHRLHAAALAGATPTTPGTAEDAAIFAPSNYSSMILIASLLLGPALVAAAFFLIRGVGESLRRSPTFDVMLVVGTLVLPTASAGLVKVAGYDPMAKAGDSFNATVATVIVLLLASIGIGIVWDWRRWLVAAGIYYAIFITLFTTIFTNGAGVGTGFVESLGYWLNQQGVQRGSQPRYYYLIILPIYEYLAIAGFLGAVILYVSRWVRSKPAQWERFAAVGTVLIAAGLVAFVLFDSLFPMAIFDLVALILTLALVQPWRSTAGRKPDRATDYEEDDDPGSATSPMRLSARTKLIIPFLMWWSVLIFAILSYAGEKMPWLITHMTVPMLFLSGWFLGQIALKVDWRSVWNRSGWAIALLLLVALAALVPVLSPLVGGTPPFRSKELNDLIATEQWLSGLAVAIGAIVAVVLLGRRLTRGEWGRGLLVLLFFVLSLFTIRTAFRLAYVTYDLAEEYIVYAHGAPGVTQVMSQITELSQRMTSTPTGLKVAYDDDSSWPFTWYFRNFSNAIFYGDSPGTNVKDAVVILAGDKNWGKVDPVTLGKYDKFEYTFLWWPMEDYKNLTLDRIRNALTNPDLRAGLWQIWFDRDYTKYGQATNEKLTLTEWPLRHRLRMYVKKDVANSLWNFGVGALVKAQASEDPLAKAYKEGVTAESALTATGGQPLNAPRGLSIGPDGAVYVADSRNHRLVIFNPDGSFRKTIGSECHMTDPDPHTGCQSDNGAGQFREPWGVAVAADGTIFVADTWNHRVEKLDKDGNFVKAWGQYGATDNTKVERPELLWGPRGIAVGVDGHVYVADTGNKRILEFTGDGEYVNQLGTGGPGEGQLDEPVGVAVDAEGKVYVADYWNTRVSIFNKDGSFAKAILMPEGSWENNTGEPRPYIALDSKGRVFVTDPEGFRVYGFNADGTLTVAFGQNGQDLKGFNMPTGIGIDKSGNIFISDSNNNRVLKFAPVQ